MDTLLLVDDVPANIKVLIEALEDTYEIIIATNGKRALHWAASDQPPDLILLDIMMPEMDGYEVCERLKANPRTRDIPVIFVTAMHEEEDETRGLALGAVDYVHKPYSLSIIKARIATHLALKKQRDALKKARAELSVANEQLEQRVAERTAALSRTNAQLVEEVYKHKKTVEQLKKAHRAAGQASRAKRDFLDNMSHEIRTPINGIMGFASLLMAVDLPGRQKSYVEMINTSTERLLATVDKILDFAKIEAEELELSGQLFSLEQLLQQSLAQVEQKAARKGLQLKQNLQQGLPPQLVGDADRIAQILFNLLENSVKFSEKGEIVLSAKLHKEHEHGLIIHFQVRDTGEGIPAAKQKLIFGPFNQADTSNTRKYEGTGLGLTISALLVEMMDGHIWLDSTPKVGTTFHVTLPLELPRPRHNLPLWQGIQQHQPTTVPAPLEPKKSTPGPTAPHILLAEDEVINRLLLQDVLENQGWRISTANNGQEAVDFFQQQPDIDLILMDIQMPVKTGHEATMAIRKIEAAQNKHRVPIIAVTAHALPSDKEKCLEAGMDDYLAKPVKAKALISKVKVWLATTRDEG